MLTSKSVSLSTSASSYFKGGWEAFPSQFPSNPGTLRLWTLQRRAGLSLVPGPVGNVAEALGGAAGSLMLHYFISLTPPAFKLFQYLRFLVFKDKAETLE